MKAPVKISARHPVTGAEPFAAAFSLAALSSGRGTEPRWLRRVAMAMQPHHRPPPVARTPTAPSATAMQGYCDWPVFGRTEMDGELFAPEFDLPGSVVPAELRISADLRPIASTMKRFR
jgi:hypothetical protein